MNHASPGSTTVYPFTTEEITTFIEKQRVIPKPDLIVLDGQGAEKFLDLLTAIQSGDMPIRKQVLINYQNHWLGLDIECKRGGEPLSIVILDAANAINNIAGFVNLLDQFKDYNIRFKLLHIASLKPLQKNSRDCSIFSWEHLCFAAQQENLHAELSDLINEEDNVVHRTFAAKYAKDFFKTSPRPVIDKIIAGLNNVSWLDYRTLDTNPDKWKDFFLNTQSCLPKRVSLDGRIKKWILDDNHNIRINYCGHRIQATLDNTEALSEDEFIVDWICKLHKQSREKIGVVLRTAVANGFVRQVSALLELSNVDVNETPPSGITALDRANGITNPITREIVTRLLVAKGAVSSRAHGIFSAVLPAGTDSVDTTASEPVVRAVL